jgi:hypothetical protein
MVMLGGNCCFFFGFFVNCNGFVVCWSYFGGLVGKCIAV